MRYCIEETQLDGVWPQQFSRSIVPYSLFDESLLMGKQVKNNKQRGLLGLDTPPTFDLVIVDEAHSSQGGKTSSAMSKALGGKAEKADDDSEDPEDLINEAIEQRIAALQQGTAAPGAVA